MEISTIKHKPLSVSIHIISWILIFCFPIIQAEWGSDLNWKHFLRNSILPLGSICLFYINFLYLIPKLLLQKQKEVFLLLNAVLVIGISIIVHYGNRYMLDIIYPEFKTSPPTPPFHEIQIFGTHHALIGHILFMTFTVTLSAAIRINLQWIKTEERLTDIERQKTDAELINLKNQLNPHFLLNTLNNIYALISFNREKAKESVLELSKLLRYALYDNQASEVPLSKELGFIENYISLMRIRLSPSVKLNVNIDAGPKPLQIAPLLFISLIENAFKHGVSPTENSFINISVTGHTDGKITCIITNSHFPKNETDKSGNGIGLEQVQQRLELLYPNQYKWEKGTNNDRTIYTSILTIQSHEL